MSTLRKRIRGLRDSLRPTSHDERVLEWSPCETCDYDIATGDGVRSCHYYACPYLPEELMVFCPTCNYDFFTGEGAPECSDPPSCDFSRQVAPQRVEMVRTWAVRHPTATREVGDPGRSTGIRDEP